MPGNLHINLYLDEDDLPPIPALAGDEERKLEPGETVAARVKLNCRKRKKIYRNSINNFNYK